MQLRAELLLAQSSMNCDYEDVLPFQIKNVKNSYLLQLSEMQYAITLY